MKKSKELQLTTLFDEKNLQRISPFLTEEFTIRNCTNKILTCIIVDKTEKPYIRKLFGFLRDPRKVHCALFVKGKNITAYFCGEEKQKEIIEILESFSKEYEYTLENIQQEKYSLFLKEFDFQSITFTTTRVWWRNLFNIVPYIHD